MPLPPQHLPPGTVIADKYELEGLLGEGGMGAVYQATNLAIGRRVAIKILHAAVADRDDVRQRFELEARAAAVISHPGIVDVLDMGQTADGEPFIVMEHLEGVTLRSIVKELKALTPEQAVAVLAPVLEALAAAHRAGVIHRDVKPANIFVCARPQVVKLLDFGVSRFGRSTGLTLSGGAVGTPRYMAPEQVLGEGDLGPEADLYSVGAVLFSLLSGRLPHGSGSDMALLARALHDHAPPLDSVAPGLPPELCRVVDQLLSKDRSQRPKDALVVKQQLEAAVPYADSAALFAHAQKASRAAALAPTPSSSASGAPRRAATGPRPSTPKPARPTAPTETHHSEAPPPRKTSPGLIAGVIVGALLLGGGGAFALKSALTPPPEPAKTTPVVVIPAPPPPPEKITVTLVAEPSSAQISASGIALGCNPCQLTSEPGTRQPVRVIAPGMAEYTSELLFDVTRTEKVVLVPSPAEPVDAGLPPVVVRKKKPKGLSVDEKNPYQ